MIVHTLEILSNDVMKRAKSLHFKLKEPEEIRYGFGWEPTVLFSHGNRRVHFYFNFYNHDRLTADVAEVLPGLKDKRGNDKVIARRAAIETTEDAWSIIDSFLRQNCGFDNLPAFSWEEGVSD